MLRIGVKRFCNAAERTNFRKDLLTFDKKFRVEKFELFYKHALEIIQKVCLI